MRSNRRYRQRYLKSKRRTVPLYGEGEDKGVYYRCRKCGWIISIKDDPGAFQGPGAKHGFHSVYVDEADYVPPYTDTKLLMDSVNATFILPEIDAVGDPIPIVYRYTSVKTGCPLCGTTTNTT